VTARVLPNLFYDIAITNCPVCFLNLQGKIVLPLRAEATPQALVAIH
jgi:hypothetical protein